MAARTNTFPEKKTEKTLCQRDRENDELRIFLLLFPYCRLSISLGEIWDEMRIKPKLWKYYTLHCMFDAKTLRSIQFIECIKVMPCRDQQKRILQTEIKKVAEKVVSIFIFQTLVALPLEFRVFRLIWDTWRSILHWRYMMTWTTTAEESGSCAVWFIWRYHKIIYLWGWGMYVCIIHENGDTIHSHHNHHHK